MSKPIAAGTSACNPYESPQATEERPRRRVVAQAFECLRILALVVFALATLGGIYSWTCLQKVFVIMSGEPSILHALPILPNWLSWSLFSLVLATPLAITLLILVCPRISLPLWTVIVPLLLVDICMCTSAVRRLSTDYGSRWPEFMSDVHKHAGDAVQLATFVSFVTLLFVWRKVPLYLWFVIVPAFAFDCWFIQGWSDL